MKDKKLQFKLTILFVVLSIVGFLSCLITALIVREKQFEYIGWFITGGIFLAFSFLSCYILIRFTKTEDYKNLLKTNRNASLNKAKTKNEDKEYWLKDRRENLVLTFENILHNYDSETLDSGKIFYKINTSIYNRKRNSSDVFFLLNENIFNTCDLKIENERLDDYCVQISKFLYSKGIEQEFINCIVIYRHTSVKEDEQNFYCNFTGLWDADIDGDKFIKNMQFTYCGVDNVTNQIFFFKPLSVDNGSEVDLNYLIIRELVKE